MDVRPREKGNIMNTIQPFIIFSVFNSDSTLEENTHRHVTVREFLDAESIKYIEVEGVYKGDHERSFLVSDTDRSRAIVENAAISYGQECILFVDANKNADLVYQDGTRESIGKWGRVGSNESPDSYTVGPRGERYTCK